jgi:DNA polymerase
MGSRTRVILWLDLETFSEVPIRSGTSRYAEGAEVLLSAFALDDDPVEVVEGWTPALTSLANSAEKIVIHNARFDRTILREQGITLPIGKVHCTQAQARSVGLPGALGTLCDILGVPVDKAKDKQGRSLIQLFCKPLPKNRKERRATKHTHPVEWARFVDYAGLDVDAMREVYKRLPTWNYQGSERQLWELDQRINERGFAIDLDLARAAISAVASEQKRLGERTVDLTDGAVESTNQRDELLKHLLEQCGVSLPDMQKGTLERRLTDENLPDTARELIAIRLEASSTSVAKYQALVNGTSSDGRLRGALEFCGASRTGRWSGRLFQPQNLVNTPDWFTGEVQEETITAIKAGAIDLIAADPIKQISYCCRGAIVAAPGKKLVVADLSNIEGRVIAWLAGEDWKLQAFRDRDVGQGHDLYKLSYSRAFSVRPEDVTYDQRQIGKIMELALGFQGAVGAFSAMARLKGVDLPEPEVLRIVKAWRQAHPSIVNLWYTLEATAHDAVRCPGVTLECGRLKLRRDGNWLRMVLPSGRALCYPSPWIDVEDRNGLTYKGINQYSRKWERITTYGGKLVENATQAVARDVLADAMLRAEQAGYCVVLSVHDELICEVPDTNDFTAEGLVEIMTANPSWAAGLPLAAEGEEMRRYRK